MPGMGGGFRPFPQPQQGWFSRRLHAGIAAILAVNLASLTGWLAEERESLASRNDRRKYREMITRLIPRRGTMEITIRFLDSHGGATGNRATVKGEFLVAEDVKVAFCRFRANFAMRISVWSSAVDHPNACTLCIDPDFWRTARAKESARSSGSIAA